MNSKAQRLLQKSRQWLQNDVFPLWTEAGIDRKSGAFVEALSAPSKATDSPRRAMVQARQTYSYSEAFKMKLIAEPVAKEILQRSTDYLISQFSLPSGAFIHAVTADGKPQNTQVDLYAQAFVLFGLARAYEILKDPKLKTRAQELLTYLRRERMAPHGGFTEIKEGKTLYQSNPHMHLFEAALAWAAVDNDAAWKTLCHELFELCRTDFVQTEGTILAEHFDEDWKPHLENEKFLFEPGHHFEWAWLLLQFEELSKISTGTLALDLFNTAEAHGVRKPEGLAVDEVWNDFEIKKMSSRFWPQTERIKAAVQLGLQAAPEDQPRFAAVADEAMKALWIFLDSPFKGAWQDTKTAEGNFTTQPPKASSLYHILCAMSEYESKRPLIKDSSDDEE